jgi:hypothetical protein
MESLQLFIQLLASEIIGQDISLVPMAVSIPTTVFTLCAILYDELKLPIDSKYKKYIAIAIGGIAAVMFYGITIPILVKGLVAGYATTKTVQKLSPNKVTTVEPLPTLHT